MLLGAHVKASGGVWRAIEHGEELGCEAIQLFAGSPRTWKPTLYSDQDAARFVAARAASPIRYVVIHTIYLINLATSNDEYYRKSVTALAGAVQAAERLGAEAVVNHTGSHQGAGFDVGLARVKAAFSVALDEVGDSKVRVLIENTAGAGGTMGVNFDEIAAIIDSVDGDPRVGVCLDTAHLFEAGFDISTEQGLEDVLARFAERIGLDRLAMLHLNDSKTPLASNRDRHENIGHGQIGLEGFRRIVNHPAFAGIPGIIEVPGMDDQGPDLPNMELLRSFREPATGL
jgi:deoxyribonuclease-4